MARVNCEKNATKDFCVVINKSPWQVFKKDDYVIGFIVFVITVPGSI